MPSSRDDGYITLERNRHSEPTLQVSQRAPPPNPLSPAVRSPRRHSPPMPRTLPREYACLMRTSVRSLDTTGRDGTAPGMLP
eukprot:365390-Chlamydomonas_euryale.AAC.15